MPHRRSFPGPPWSFSSPFLAGAATLVLPLLFFLAVRPALAQDPALYTVCLDPGHRLSDDVGASSTALVRGHQIGLREVDLNLDVSHALRVRLEAAGVRVVMTWDAAHVGWPETGAPDAPPPPFFAAEPGPNDPEGLEARGRLCVAGGAQVMFSVHHNSLPAGGNGLVTLFRDPGTGQRDPDRAVAKLVHSVMWRELNPGKTARAFIDFGLLRRDWGIARGALGIPAVILEPVAMSDPQEAQRLVPTIAQGGLRRLQIVEAELAAILAAQAVVERRTLSSAP